MTQERRILVCVLPDLKVDHLQNYVVNSALFAHQIAADIHFLVSIDTLPALMEALKTIPSDRIQTIQLIPHLTHGSWPSEVVTEAIKIYSCELMVIPAGSRGENVAHGAQVREALLEESQIPIFILSPKVDLAKTPIGSILIPLRGEVRVSSALKFGLRLAALTHTPVDLVHVLDEENQKELSTVSSLNTLGDQPHHEYPQLLDRILAEASPLSDLKERAQVRRLYYAQGIPAVEILKTANQFPSCALVAEWHGSLTLGKAKTVKKLLRQIVIPIFLVKAEPKLKSILKMGPEEHAA